LTVTVDRRIFLIAGAAGALVLGIEGCARKGAPVAPGTLGAWVAVAPDGIVTVRVNSSELGQGAQTGIAQIVADEMDADWSKVRVEMAPVTDAYLRADDGGYYTGGSSSIRPQFDLFRKAGGTARAMLIAAAAKQWSVDPQSCTAKSGQVLDSSGRALSYGALASAASAVAVPDNVKFKSREARVFIGKPMQRLDIPKKVNGEAIYGIDVKIPGMLIAAIRQCPYQDGDPQDFDPAPALAIKGVRRVVTLDSAVAVVADNFWAAKKGIDAIDPKWERSSDAVESNTMFADLVKQIGAADSEIANEGDKQAVVARVNAALAGAHKIIEADYQVPFLAHAPMEPMNATARADAKSCELWIPTQNQEGVRGDVAKALGLPKSAITVHTTFVGGGFGRRLETDFAVQAAQIAKQMGKPVKLIWTREEDFARDFYRPASVARLKAALDKDMIVRAIDYSGATTNNHATDGLTGSYAIADIVIRQHKSDLPVMTGSWRSVDPSMTVFFGESLIDEIAHEAGIDPLTYRRKLLAQDARGLRVLDTAAQMANWGHAPAGRFQGVAFFHGLYWKTIVAEIVEISVDRKNRITVHRVFCAIDPGIAVNPDQVAAQAQGGIVMGLSAALGEAITLKDGRTVETNFDSYKIMRLGASPDIVIQVLESPDAPIGSAGEPPVPPAAPALANALFAATGKRIRKLPLSQSGYSV
jgi:isoquinoline 1-oxidoreductase beta subunit